MILVVLCKLANYELIKLFIFIIIFNLFNWLNWHIIGILITDTYNLSFIVIDWFIELNLSFLHWLLFISFQYY